HVVAVEEHTAGPHQYAERAVQRDEMRCREPMQGGCAEYGIDARRAHGLHPAWLGQIGIYPTQAIIEAPDRALSEREHHGVEVDRDAAGSGKTLEEPLADRSRPASQIERDELAGQQRLQHIEHDPESLFAFRHIPGLL